MTISAEDKLKLQEKLLNRISGIIILLNVILIGVESSIRGNLTADLVFIILDIVFVGYFTFEISFRIFKVSVWYNKNDYMWCKCICSENPIKSILKILVSK